MKLIQGDCLEEMKKLEDNSIDSIVTDPPYGLKFMGKKWDYQIPGVEVWQEVLRVLKPGGHALIACGTRTQHRMAVNIEDAGFEIRDVVSYLYGSGFPKSHNIFKALKKKCTCGIMVEYENGTYKRKTSTQKTEPHLRSMQETNLPQTITNKKTEGEVLQSGLSEQSTSTKEKTSRGIQLSKGEGQSSLEGWSAKEKNPRELSGSNVPEVSKEISTNGEKRRLYNATQASNGSTPEQIADENRSGTPRGSQPKQQQDREPCTFCKQFGTQALRTFGLGTALKPACEFWTLARKPLSEKTIAKNVLKWGTGGINIDGCRVGTTRPGRETIKNENGMFGLGGGKITKNVDGGRFPANLIHDGSDEVVSGFPNTKSGGKKNSSYTNENDGIFTPGGEQTSSFYGSSGSASRFFYCAKASKSERLINRFYCAKIGEWQEENTEQVVSLVKVILDLVVPNLSIGGFGEKQTEAYPEECLSTIRTKISKITELKTWNLLMQQPTKDFIMDVFGKKMDGGNHAQSVKSSKELTTRIGIFQEKVGFCTEDVKNATYQSLLKLKEQGVWQDAHSHHPTHKPIKLMTYLCRLITPPKGIVLDPFMGSGTTGIAAQQEGFDFIGIELDPEYFKIAKARINKCQESLYYYF